ncbi:MAG: NUDIX hydrolase [Clostridia bacterium]|nr:NUDIX hydrolase [Clostridia bacterium]
MELWDAYDRNFNKIANTVLVRGEEIPDGMFHLVCDVLVKHTDGTYLLMQRDYTKHLGGMWEATAGGSALKGETPLECAKRELFEETGITSADFTQLGTVVCDSHKSIYFDYLCVTVCDKNTITLQTGETIDYMWVTHDKLKSMHTELASKRILQFI